jgi:hypothetical protein
LALDNRQIDSDALDQLKNNPDYYRTSSSLLDKLDTTPVPRSELLRNLFLYMDRRALSRFLFLNELYQTSISLHGSVFEFGVRYGVNTCLFTSLRGIYEPYNHNRKIVSFDTFSGFPSTSNANDSDNAETGQFSVPKTYEDHLEEVLMIHEKLAPLDNIKKFELVKGDVMETLPAYIEQHQETMISLAYFDFDLFEPTLFGLSQIEPYLVDGAIIGFDEINCEEWPGETLALRKWIRDRNMPVYHSKFKSAGGYLVFKR